jgi:hypothetical protein
LHVRRIDIGAFVHKEECCGHNAVLVATENRQNNADAHG